jgi:hypothetical protein
MKTGKHRDKIAAKEGVIGFEMEGAGVWDLLFRCTLNTSISFSWVAEINGGRG